MKAELNERSTFTVVDTEPAASCNHQLNGTKKLKTENSHEMKLPFLTGDTDSHGSTGWR